MGGNASPAVGDRERVRLLRRDVFMVGLAIVSIGILVAEEQGGFPPLESDQLLYLDLLIVGVFWVEYVARLRAVAPGERRAYVLAHWYDLPGMVPIFPGMEAIAGVRVLRLLRVLRILRLLGALSRFDRFNRFVDRFTRRSKLGYIAVLAFAIITTCATVAWVFEPETFPTFGDAMWWGVVTATTVGYGDFYPRTGAGRIAAVFLMFLGVGLIGTFAATLSSVLVERRFEDEDAERAAGSAEGAAPGALPVGFALASELERLARLRERGALTEEEFAAAKRRLLG